MSNLPERIGDYPVLSELGRGAMGVVYLCQHPHLGRKLAVKVMAAQVANEADFVERFRREGAMAAKLRHPHIVQVYDQSSRDGVFFIAMEYLGSRTLKDLLRESGPLAVPEACRLIDQLLSALEHAHGEGVVHRDIKPSNVMVTDQGQLALTDFSIAFSESTEKLTRTGMAVGTPEYMAPEQFDGKADARSDLYAAGILLYEMLTGFTPFQAPTLTEVMKKQVLLEPEPLNVVDFTIPEAISQWTARALSKEPQQRFASAAEMREALKVAVQAPSRPAEAAAGNVASVPQGRGGGLALGSLILLGLLGLALGARGLKGGAASSATPTPRASLAAPTSSMTQRVTVRMSPTPNPATSGTPSPQPEAAYRVDQVDGDTPEMPAQAEIRPGQGVGEINLGDERERVEAVWGPPYRGSVEESMVVWTYLRGDEVARLFFDPATSKLQRIAVSGRGFSLKEAPDLSVGVDEEAVVKRLAEPSRQENGLLDYAPLGITFEFNTRSSRTEAKYGANMCEQITVYEPAKEPML